MNKTTQLHCIRTCVEDNTEYWTKNCTYDTTHTEDGTWEIETNIGTIGCVGDNFLLDSNDFPAHFEEVA